MDKILFLMKMLVTVETYSECKVFFVLFSVCQEIYVCIIFCYKKFASVFCLIYVINDFTVKYNFTMFAFL